MSLKLLFVQGCTTKADTTDDENGDKAEMTMNSTEEVNIPRLLEIKKFKREGTTN